LALGSRWEAPAWCRSRRKCCRVGAQQLDDRGKRWGLTMSSLLIGVAIVVALFVAIRIALRIYFPPDT
jgi:hypothetical protein